MGRNSGKGAVSANANRVASSNATTQPQSNSEGQQGGGRGRGLAVGGLASVAAGGLALGLGMRSPNRSAAAARVVAQAIKRAKPIRRARIRRGARQRSYRYINPAVLATRRARSLKFAKTGKVSRSKSGIQRIRNFARVKGLSSQRQIQRQVVGGSPQSSGKASFKKPKLKVLSSGKKLKLTSFDLPRTEPGQVGNFPRGRFRKYPRYARRKNKEWRKRRIVRRSTKRFFRPGSSEGNS